MVAPGYAQYPFVLFLRGVWRKIHDPRSRLSQEGNAIRPPIRNAAGSRLDGYARPPHPTGPLTGSSALDPPSQELLCPREARPYLAGLERLSAKHDGPPLVRKAGRRAFKNWLCASAGSPGLEPQALAIGIGADGIVPSVPSHTTGHTGPYPAVRMVEVSWQVSGFPSGRSSSLAERCSVTPWSSSTSGVSSRPPAELRPGLPRGVSSLGRWFSLASTVGVAPCAGGGGSIHPVC